MSREKQIDEMVNDLCGFYINTIAEAEQAAEHLISKGWRKQSEGEWKQTEEPMGWHDVDCAECSACGESWVLDDNLDFDLIVEHWHFCPNCGAKMKGGAE